MEQIDLAEFFRYYLSKIIIVVIGIGLLVVAGNIYSLIARSPLYESNTTIVLASESKDSATYTQNDLQLNQKLVSTYSQIIKNVRFLVRKTAHMSEYFVLVVLTFCLVSNYVSSNKKVFLITFICCVLFSIGDEIHQLFIPGRTGRIFDVGVDSCGILLGCILLTFIKHKTDKKKLQNI